MAGESGDAASPAGREAVRGAPPMSAAPSPPEVWLRGPVADVPAALQPVAHALLGILEELEHIVPALSREELAMRPGGAPSIGFHVRHLLGSIDRLFTYAAGRALSDAQRAALAREPSAPFPDDDGPSLLMLAGEEIARAVDLLRTTDVATLHDRRDVGRARLPSSVGGLLFHAAEHGTRHLGQIVTTSRIVRAGDDTRATGA